MKMCKHLLLVIYSECELCEDDRRDLGEPVLARDPEREREPDDGEREPDRDREPDGEREPDLLRDLDRERERERLPLFDRALPEREALRERDRDLERDEAESSSSETMRRLRFLPALLLSPPLPLSSPLATFRFSSDPDSLVEMVAFETIRLCCFCDNPSFLSLPDGFSLALDPFLRPRFCFGISSSLSSPPS